MSDAAAAKSDGGEEANNHPIDAKEENHADGDGGEGEGEGDDEGEGDGDGAGAGGSGSGATSTTPQAGKTTTTVKDKHCQYCHQPFTSSSLGRHLDQYLFKKKPDGIHDVEEIRRLRSTITRRTARNSSAHQQQNNEQKQEVPGHYDASTAAAGAGAGGATAGTAGTAAKRSPDPHSAPPLQLNPGQTHGGYRVMLNQPSWHATGVINDIPNSSKVSQFRIPPSGRDPYGRISNSSTTPSLSNPESVRALELALQEVLDSIKAATTRAQPQSSPFDFDIQSQTFPALCLHALPPPPSLFSTHPFPSPGSFPLNPPTADQHEAVRHALRSKIQQWKVEQLAAAAVGEGQGESGGYNTSTPLPAMDPAHVERTALHQEDLIMRQLDLSLNYWLSLPLETRRDTWQLEITRAFARENEHRKKAEEQLQRTQQEANYLRTQVEKLASCQWPREFAIFPPDMLPLSPAVARDLDNKESKLNAADSPRWDYDNLISKWKRVVMHDKSMGRVGVGSTSESGTLDPLQTARVGGGGGGGGQTKSQYATKNARPPPNLPGPKLSSPPRRMNPVTPDYSPRTKQRQLSASHGATFPAHATRVTPDAADSSRPAKRQRTTLDERPRSPAPGAERVPEHGQQQTQRLPSLSAASTPLSASSPYQPSPYSSGVHQQPYHHQSSSSAASMGVSGGEPTGNHNPYQPPPGTDRRIEQTPSGGTGPGGGGGCGGETSGGTRTYAYAINDPSSHRETKPVPNDAANGPSSAGTGDSARMPSVNTLPRPDEKVPDHSTDDSRRNAPGSLLTMYPRADGP